MNFCQKIIIKKIKKNALLAGHRAGMPCCPVNRLHLRVDTRIISFLCLIH
jgi:hypothetical protein